MVRFLSLIAVLMMAVPTLSHASAKMKPFVLAATQNGDVATVAAATKTKLTAAGFDVVGEYTPYDGATILIATNDALKAIAAKSDFGGYGAAQRISITKAAGTVQVSFTNPQYMASAYRMADSMTGIRQQLATALGEASEYGMADGMDDDDLRGYHYMFGMEYFDEPSELNKFSSHQAAVSAVEKGLAAKTSGVSKVYRIDIPGKDETVFGVAMDGTKGEGNMQDDTYIMNKIDFQDVKSTGHLPYEILVSGDTAYSLYARFRIAINFPDLSMMGSNSFMSIMESPETIRRALTRTAGGKAEIPAE